MVTPRASSSPDQWCDDRKTPALQKKHSRQADVKDGCTEQPPGSQSSQNVTTGHGAHKLVETGPSKPLLDAVCLTA